MLFGAFKHYPNAGFRASLYWKAFKDGHFSKVKASYTKNEVFSHGDGWLHVGRDNYTNKDRYLVNIDFHFSVFSYAGKYIYQISAVPDPNGPQHFQGYLLEKSFNGFLGLYRPPLLLDNDNPPYWHFPGLNPFDLSNADIFLNMKMWGGDGPHTGKGQVGCNDDDPNFSCLSIGGTKGTFEMHNFKLDRLQ